MKICNASIFFSVLWTKLAELSNFTRSPILAGQESENLVWAVGGRELNGRIQFGQPLTDVSDRVQTIDLSSGQVTHKREMVFNKNISNGCAIMIDDQSLYIIGGDGNV